MQPEMDLYVYYRVASAHAAELRDRAEAMQHDLAREHGIRGQLKRRPAEKEGMQTWLEVYAGVTPAFEAALEQAVHDAELPALIAGGRNTEIFVDIAPCA